MKYLGSNEDRLLSDEFHQQMTEGDSMWHDNVDGEFMGRFVFSSDFSVTGDNVPVYHFDPMALIDDFIQENTNKNGELCDKNGIDSAEAIRVKLTAMLCKINKLKAAK